LAEQLDRLEALRPIRFTPAERKPWLDATEAAVREWYRRSTEIRNDQGTFIGYACMDCGRPVQDWAAGDDEWEKVMAPENGEGHICADCFMRRSWRLQMHLHLVRYCEDGET
jgi:DNA-directed RNA polymerase subunit RPC12/RpoP